ncbi:hypothetical protein BpHYR1_019993 [Brachionus plicatilis]|uniref:Uncharacterized protein n=1 Tax=Brachionus plicatilis TaxID=10195 RepID=A0A3M7P728_BRAPC|nr:hypothetical protein BpHYR1_019993 [Brachionus plicatilis]
MIANRHLMMSPMLKQHRQKRKQESSLSFFFFIFVASLSKYENLVIDQNSKILTILNLIKCGKKHHDFEKCNLKKQSFIHLVVSWFTKRERPPSTPLPRNKKRLT